MAVTITTLQAQDSISGSRLTINANFSALKTAVDASQLLLDPATSILTGVKSASIADSAVSLATSIFNVSKAAAILGNITLGTSGQATSVLINGTGGVVIDASSLTLNTGNITLGGTASLLTLTGNLTLSKELRLPGSAAAFSSIVGLTSSGSVSVSEKKYIVIRNDSIASGLTASLSTGSAGQVVEIFHVLGASGFPVYISTTNFSGLTGGIQMKKQGDTLKCVYDGSSWYLWNYSSAAIAGTSGATGSSVLFTTT